MTGFGSATEIDQSKVSPEDRRQVQEHLNSLSGDQELDTAYALVTARVNLLSHTQLAKLKVLVDPQVVMSSGADMSLKELYLIQKRALQGLTLTAFQPDGRMKNSNADPRDVKDSITALAQLTKMVGQIEEQVYSSDRVMKIESALIETVRELPEEAQNQFFNRLEEALQAKNDA